MRRVVLFRALVLLAVGMVACQATVDEGEVPDERALTATLTASPTITHVVTMTPTEATTPTPSPTPLPTHTPTLSPTRTPTYTPTPLPPAATATSPPRSGCPPDVGCLKVVNQCGETLTCRLSDGGDEREILLEALSDGTMHLPPGQYTYRAMVEVSACDTGRGRTRKQCQRIGLDLEGPVTLAASKTTQLSFGVACHEWDAGDCMGPELALLEVTEPAPTPTVPGSPTPTPTATPVCLCPPNAACLTVENRIGDPLTIEIAGTGIAEVMQIDSYGQGAFELPPGGYEYTAHTRTGYRCWDVFGRCDACPSGPIYLRGSVDIQSGLCHRLPISVSCGWWDEGRCFNPELVVAE